MVGEARAADLAALLLVLGNELIQLEQERYWILVDWYAKRVGNCSVKRQLRNGLPVATAARSWGSGQSRTGTWTAS